MIQKRKYQVRITERVIIKQEYAHDIEALSEEDAKNYAFSFFKDRNYANEKTLIATNTYPETQEHAQDTVATLEFSDGTLIAQDRF